MTRVDSSVSLMCHDPSDLGSLILIQIQITPKECTIRISPRLDNSIRISLVYSKSIPWLYGWVYLILGDPGAVNGGARKINRRDERFHESLQGGVKEPLGTDSHQTISKRLGECWLLIGQKILLYYSAQSANGSFWGTLVCSYTAIVAWYFSRSYLRGKLSI